MLIKKSYLNDQDLTDVTLVTMDKEQIQTHKVILSPYSPFLEKIFYRNTHYNPFLDLKGIRQKDNTNKEVGQQGEVT